MTLSRKLFTTAAACTAMLIPFVPATAHASTNVASNMGTGIYEADNATTGASFISRSQSETTAASKYGFSNNDGLVFDAASTPTAGLVAVHRLWNATTGFVYIPEGNEMKQAIAKYGYKDQQIEFYASLQPATGLVPVYRLWSPSKHFFFTANDEVKDKKLAAGYTGGNVVFYVKPATSASDVTGNHLGVSTPWVFENTSDYQNSVFSKVKQTGSKYVRIDLPMYAISQGDNEPYTYDFTRADTLVNNAIANGLTPLVILGTLPGNLVPNSNGNAYAIATGPTTPHELQAYNDYVKAVVSRYKDKIYNWELWNEENLTGSWGGSSSNPNQPAPSAAAYTNMLKTVYPTIKSVQSNSTVLVGGTGDGGNTGDISSQDFITQLYANGAKNYFDALAVHVYGNAVHNSTEFIDQLPKYRAIMDNNGDTHKKLWITESGDRVEDNLATVDQQAAMEDYTVKAWESIHDRGPLFVFTIENNLDHGFGLVDDNENKRPAFYEWQKIAGTPYPN